MLDKLSTLIWFLLSINYNAISIKVHQQWLGKDYIDEWWSIRSIYDNFYPTFTGIQTQVLITIR